MFLVQTFVTICLISGYLANAAPVEDSAGKTEENILMEFIPKEEIKSVVEYHLATDEGFQGAIKYLKSEEWAQMISKMKENEDWKTLKQIFKDHGMDIDELIQLLEHCLDSTDVSKLKGDISRANIAMFVADLQMHLARPIVETLNKIRLDANKWEKLEKLSEELGKESNKQLIQRINKSPELQAIMNKLKTLGFPSIDLMQLFPAV